MYQYRAKLLRVIDGDTVDIEVDLGFKIFHDIRVRLGGVNAPEKNTSEGMAAKAFVIMWFADPVKAGLPIDVYTRKDSTEKYGRYLADIYCNGESLCQAMLAAGFAVPYDGGTR